MGEWVKRGEGVLPLNGGAAETVWCVYFEAESVNSQSPAHPMTTCLRVVEIKSVKTHKAVGNISNKCQLEYHDLTLYDKFGSFKHKQ